MTVCAKLIATDAVVSCPEILLTTFPMRVGRSAEADISVEDRWVSREHCEIDRVDNTLVVRDLGSKHGTFVNGRPVTEVELKSGDTLNIGLSRFLVEYEEVAASADVGSDVLAVQSR
jgi:pSer/pThr/pTyr-binding forkhead associated (FHA) protein